MSRYLIYYLMFAEFYNFFCSFLLIYKFFRAIS